MDALTKLGEAESAEVSAKRFAAAFPERLEPPLLLARAWSAQGRHAEALRQVAEVAERFGRRPEIEARRVWTLGLAGRVDEGIRVAREATAAHSDSARLHQALAELLFANGATDEGARAVDRALELDPEDPTPLRTRCEFRAASGRLDGARNDCERYLRVRPDDPKAHYVVGAVHAEAGRIPEAIASYQRAAALDDRAFAPRNNLAEWISIQNLRFFLSWWMFQKPGIASRSLPALDHAGKSGFFFSSFFSSSSARANGAARKTTARAAQIHLMGLSSFKASHLL